MNRILVLYTSKYGSTKKYVDMIKSEISCEVYKINSFNFDNINKYDFIIFAGGIYASGISGIKYIQKNIQSLSEKNIVVFAVGASPFDEKAFEMVKKHNLKNIPVDIPMFYGRGAYDENVMDFKDRTLCRLLKKSLSKKDPVTFEPWMEAFFEANGKSCDWTNKIYLEPLFAYMKPFFNI